MNAAPYHRRLEATTPTDKRRTHTPDDDRTDTNYEHIQMELSEVNHYATFIPKIKHTLDVTKNKTIKNLIKHILYHLHNVEFTTMLFYLNYFASKFDLILFLLRIESRT